MANTKAGDLRTPFKKAVANFIEGNRTGAYRSVDFIKTVLRLSEHGTAHTSRWAVLIWSTATAKGTRQANVNNFFQSVGHGTTGLAKHLTKLITTLAELRDAIVMAIPRIIDLLRGNNNDIRLASMTALYKLVERRKSGLSKCPQH